MEGGNGVAVLTPKQTGRDYSPAPPRSFAQTKRWVSQMFFEELNRFSEDDNGNMRSNGQLMVENVVRLATDPSGDPYVQLAAAKFISERLEGKAGVMNDEVQEESHQIVICVGDVSAQQIKKAIKENEGAEPKEDVVVQISDGDGSNSAEVIV